MFVFGLAIKGFVALVVIQCALCGVSVKSRCILLADNCAVRLLELFRDFFEIIILKSILRYQSGMDFCQLTNTV